MTHDYHYGRDHDAARGILIGAIISIAMWGILIGTTISIAMWLAIAAMVVAVTV